ncbi:hypothetical protein P7K49_006149 [Saguinus oedipus]|uniref:Uncharacterized protein n=1 Tax=Saguinus oedipus TaxID=9490 RepID=A0ABQ9W403_SAGOE|nr:hypothetical protein P7K49_006149 [Saguinus oedipus]
MMKYTEIELKKTKGIMEHEEKKVKPRNAGLYELPENTHISSAKKNKEMFSNQRLSGIPELDLSISARIKNISVEDAKAHLLAEQQNKKKRQ